EELGGMNIMFVMQDGRIITPPLNGSILPGITRDSLIRLAAEAGHPGGGQPYRFGQGGGAARGGRLRECFACGAAAGSTPIAEVKSKRGAFMIGNGGGGEVARTLKDRLVGIQYGRVEDKHGWLTRLA